MQQSVMVDDDANKKTRLIRLRCRLCQAVLDYSEVSIQKRPGHSSEARAKRLSELLLLPVEANPSLFGDGLVLCPNCEKKMARLSELENDVNATLQALKSKIRVRAEKKCEDGRETEPLPKGLCGTVLGMETVAIGSDDSGWVARISQAEEPLGEAPLGAEVVRVTAEVWTGNPTVDTVEESLSSPEDLAEVEGIFEDWSPNNGGATGVLDLDNSFWVQNAKGCQPVACNFCDQRLFSKEQVQRHMQSQHPALRAEQLAFPSLASTEMVNDEEDELNREMGLSPSPETFVSPMSENMICEFCGLSLPSEEASTHSCMVEQEESVPIVYVCSSCGKVFRSGPGILNHFVCSRACVDDGEAVERERGRGVFSAAGSTFVPPLDEANPFFCPFCFRKLRNPFWLSRHIATFHALPTPFACLECGLRFPDLAFKRIHAAFHSCNSVHVCDLCGKCLPTQHSYQRHRVLHKMPPVSPPFPCPICPKEFMSRDTMNKHFNSFHDNASLQFPSFSLSCSTCSLRFPYADWLSRHRDLYHPLDVPHKCRKCLQRFSDFRELLVHERIHEGRDPYICSFCNCTFGQAWKLRKHLRNRHSIQNQDFALVLIGREKQ